MASKYKKNKVKFKLTKELVFLILGLLAIIGTTIALSIPNNKEKITTEINDAIELANASSTEESPVSYSYIPQENVYETIKHDDLINEIANEEYVYVLYGSTNNSLFLSNASTLNTMAQSEELETVYIYSSLWVEETEDKEAEEFKLEKKSVEDAINANKDKDVEGFSVLNYPAILVFHNGSLVFNTQQYDDLDYSTWSIYIQKAIYISKANKSE